MLRDLDETIKNLLTKAGGFDPNQVDISFKIPNREWSEKEVQRPTLNCYLFDIHERRALREEGWRPENRKEARRQPPLFFELTYLITAWTRNIEDEHMLLWEVLETLVRFPTLNDPNVVLERKPRDDMRANRWAEAAAALPPNTDKRPRLTECLHGSLADYPWPITAQIAQLEGVLKSPGEFWTALENHLKPSLSYVVTLGLDRQAMRAGPPVLATGINILLPEAEPGQKVYVNQLFSLPHGTAPGDIAVEIANESFRAKTASDGSFTLKEKLEPGQYVLRAQIAGKERRRIIVVRGAANAPNRFTEVLRDQHGQPIAGAGIEVEGYDLHTTSDKDGQFTFELPPGQYTLRVDIDGWVVRREITVADARYRMRLGYGGVPSASQAS